MLKRFFIFSAILSCFLLSGQVSAQQPSVDVDTMIDQYARSLDDIFADNTLSKDEYQNIKRAISEIIRHNEIRVNQVLAVLDITTESFAEVATEKEVAKINKALRNIIAHTGREMKAAFKVADEATQASLKIGLEIASVALKAWREETKLGLDAGQAGLKATRAAIKLSQAATGDGLKIGEQAVEDALDTDDQFVKGESFTLHLPGGMEMAMQWIPPGEFYMGSPDEEIDEICEVYGWFGDSDDQYTPYFKSEAPRHRVRITRGFWIGCYEVTWAQWHAVMQGNPSLSTYDTDGVPSGLEKCPVTGVTWNECRDFAETLSRASGFTCRLPTEAQWEYVCRAGTTSRFVWGDEFTQEAGYCNIENIGLLPGNDEWRSLVSEDGSMPVGSFPPNPWNLYDLHGNVCEWCRDWYSATYYSSCPEEDPIGPESGTERVIKGGGYNSDQDSSRCATRNSSGSSKGFGDTGFRIVIEPEE